MGIIFGEKVVCRSCRGTGQREGRACGVCLGTGLEQLRRDPPSPKVTGPTTDRRPFDVGMERSELSASSGWTVVERMMVTKAIEKLAQRGEPFTADDVWAELPADFPVNKGIASVLNTRVRAGIIINTGRTVISQRTGEHGHAQRLTVWVGKPVEHVHAFHAPVPAAIEDGDWDWRCTCGARRPYPGADPEDSPEMPGPGYDAQTRPIR